MLEHLGAILPRAAVRFGDKIALHIEDRSFSYRQLDTLSNRLANALIGVGVSPGDRVTLYAGNSWEWIVSYYGALKVGAIINPLNVMLTPDEVKFVANDCRARVILSTRDKGEALLAIRKDTPLEHVILFGEDAPPGAHRFEELIGAAREEFVSPEIAPLTASTIGYTSGTTGRPKGAVTSHRAVMLNSAMFANMNVRNQADTAVTAVPCAHVYGNVVMNGAFLTGMTLALAIWTKRNQSGECRSNR
jgi:long-chain acyl-CoA synthetase